MPTQNFKRKRINPSFDRKRIGKSKKTAPLKKGILEQINSNKEDELWQNQALYRTLVEESFDGIFIQQGSKIIFANRRLHGMLGYEQGELEGLDHWQVYHPDYHELTRNRAQARMRGEMVPSQYEVKLQRKDGSSFHGEINAKKIVINHKPGIQVWVRDITKLKEKEEKYRIIINTAIDGFWFADMKGNFLDVNEGYCRLTGYSQDELLSMRITDIEAVEKEEEVTHRIQKIKEVGRDLFQTRHKCKDGRIIDVEVSVNFMEIDDGRMFVFLRDITDRRRAEEKLQAEKKRFQILLENAPFGMVMIDQKGCFKYINPQFKELFGYELSDVPDGKTWFRKAYPDPTYRHHVIKIWNEDLKRFKKGDRIPRIFTAVCKDGTKKIVNFITVLLETGEYLMTCEDVTKRRRAEEALRESEERYRTILENIEDGYYEVNLQGDLTFFNDSLCRMLGYSKDEMIGMSNRQYTDEENRKKLFRTFNEVYKTGKPTKAFDWEVIRKDGGKVNGEVSVSLIKDMNGQAVGFRGIARDITERKRTEEALRLEKQRFQTLSEQAPFGMVMIDHDGSFRYINPKFRELFGYDLSDIPDGRTWFRKAYPNPTYRHQVISAWKKDLTNKSPGERRSQIFTVTCKDGTEKIINFIPVQLETGENLMTCEDITERKRAEESLEKSEMRFMELFNDAPVGYFEYNVEGLITNVNRTYLEMLGYKVQEIIGQPVWKFMVDGEKVRQQILGKLAGTISPARGIERVYRRKDGTQLTGLIEDRLLKNSEGNIIGIRSTIQDISDRKRAEEEMQILEEQLRQSQKMEAIGQLAGGIAHDFNNLLTIVKGYCQLSLLDLKERDPLKKNIQEIEKATERAANLTQQLLAFSRRQILDFKVLDMNTLLKDLEKMLRRIIGEDVELIMVLAKELGRIKIDPGQFGQMVLNLVINARDAMPSGGKLTIETANVELNEEYTRNHMGIKPGLYVQLSISDTGIGIPSDIREKIFDPFFTTKDKSKGTGLGLSMVYGIVKQSGGTIWVYSELGHGTTFKVYLPRVEEELDHLHTPKETEFLPRGNETILLVEDESSVRDLADRILSTSGYKVLTASNGEEALRVAQGYAAEKIHLLFTDVVMPQMSGKDLADQLKAMRPDIKVLYASGYTDNAIVHHGALHPGIHFLQKPFSPKALSQKVREILDG